MSDANDKDRLRRHQVAQLAQSLRQHMLWQQSLGASGAPRASAEQRQDLRDRIKAARQRPTQPRRRAEAASSAPAPQSRSAPPPRRSTPAESQQASGVRNEVRELMEVQAPRDINHSGLQGVRDALGDCRRCKLHEGRQNIVFGVGSPAAEIVFIGEAPGFHEDVQGEPFVGKAGQLLDRMIGAMGLSRDRVYICNIIKCRPPGNRDPEADEMAACEPFLVKQLETLQPKVIVTLGRYAAQALLRDSTGITRLRGKWRSYQNVPVMPTFHPAYLLRNPSAKRPCWEDLQQVMKKAGLSG